MQCEECNTRPPIQDSTFCQECSEATKECRDCLVVKSIFEFAKNQHKKSGERQRRSECEDCRKVSRKPIPSKLKTEYQNANPPPIVGDTFQCPVCERMFTVRTVRDVNLDHDAETGEIRGYVCGDCNTGMGKMSDSISTLARAILWIKQVGKIFDV